MAIKEVFIPDIGGATDVDVIEINVAVGDTIAKEDALITLEGDKATMEIPAPFAGVVTELKLAVGDKVSEGAVILTLEVAAESQATDAKTAASEESHRSAASEASSAGHSSATEASSAGHPSASEAYSAGHPSASEARPEEPQNNQPTIQQVGVPDLGGATEADVIEINVAVGDEVAIEDPLVTLEGEKATMEIPAPIAGKIIELHLKLGDKVSAGDAIVSMETIAPAATTPVAQKPAPAKAAASSASRAPTPQPDVAGPPPAGSEVHASPSVRRIAYEFGVDLHRVAATGRKNRILKEDVQRFVKAELAKAASGSGVGLNLAPAPKVDYAKFGEIERKPLNKIKKLTGQVVHRSWVTIPHVTQFGEADITDLETFRKTQKQAAEERGVKLTPLVFIMKAVVGSLKAFPQFNTSLDETGENLIFKKYYNIGIAVDTPNGLVVPVIRNVECKGMFELAEELATISVKARDVGLSPADMAGSTFTISSLGGIGGTAFTPIVKAPDVAILGVSRSSYKPVYQGNEFVPRLVLPLSLSYDHRVIDGADGARFMVDLSNRLANIDLMLL